MSLKRVAEGGERIATLLNTAALIWTAGSALVRLVRGRNTKDRADG